MIPAFHYMVALTEAKSIKVAKYALFGSQELSKNIVNARGIAPGRAYQQAMERVAIEHFNAFGRAEGRSGLR